MKTAITGDLRERAIPLSDRSASALDYHAFPIDLQSQLAAEPLVDAATRGLAVLSFYAVADGTNAPYYRSFKQAPKSVWVRTTIAERLLQVNKGVSEYGVELLLLDGYRPISLQQELWDHFIAEGKLAQPAGSLDDWVNFAGQFCSDPRGYKEEDFRTWPTHNTGGAIDLTLRSIATGQMLFMGSIFDDAAEVSFTDYFERTQSPADIASIAEARRNRRLLYWAMTAGGFANYPYEWWHFDLFTQMWVMNSTEKSQDLKASYGRAKQPF